MVQDPYLPDLGGIEGRIGLFGGSFDPVHRAHLEIARRARDAAALDRVIFLPAARSPFKRAGANASEAHRLEMLRLALQGEGGFFVAPLEFEREGPSYTRDTLLAIRSVAAPGAQLHFILGSDCLPSFPDWRAVDELFDLTEFIVVEREGFARSDLGQLAGRLGPAQLDRLRRGFVSAAPIAVSSSQIRERLAAGEDVSRDLHPAVAAYIREHRLYR